MKHNFKPIQIWYNLPMNKLNNLGRIIITVCMILFTAMPLFAESEEDKIETILGNPTTLIYPSKWHTPFGIHKGNPFWLRVFLGTRTVFNNPQDLAATKLETDYGKINKDSDDWQLVVYGVNSGNSEIIYNISMHSLGVYGRQGTGDGEFMHPIGIACNEKGDVYVADTGNNRIVRLYNDGKKIRHLRNIGKPGSGPGEFNNPTYVALDSLGSLYVSDTGNNRIQVFGKSGGLIKIIDRSTATSLSSPGGICVSDVYERFTGYRNNAIYVIDGNNSRIQKLNFDGGLIRAVRLNELLKKEVNLTTLEQDYYGNVYVVDNKNSKIYKFSPDLDYITAFGEYGTNDYQFENPTGIAIYKHYGQIFVSDKESAQYFWIGSDMLNFKSEFIKGETMQSMKFDFFLTERGYVTIEIDAGDKKTVKASDKIQFNMGNNSLLWDIPEEFRLIFYPGIGYRANIRVQSTYSSYPYMEKLIEETVFFH